MDAFLDDARRHYHTVISIRRPFGSAQNVDAGNKTAFLLTLSVRDGVEGRYWRRHLPI
jgi:hypothetical protein